MHTSAAALDLGEAEIKRLRKELCTGPRCLSIRLGVAMITVLVALCTDQRRDRLIWSRHHAVMAGMDRDDPDSRVGFHFGKAALERRRIASCITRAGASRPNFRSASWGWAHPPDGLNPSRTIASRAEQGSGPFAAGLPRG